MSPLKLSLTPLTEVADDSRPDGEAQEAASLQGPRLSGMQMKHRMCSRKNVDVVLCTLASMIEPISDRVL